MRSASLLLLTLVACSGLTARQEALLPAMQLAWPGVESDIRAGIDSGASSGRITPTTAADLTQATEDMGAALQSGDPLAMAAIPWLALIDQANAGIEHKINTGAISTGVGESLKERVRQFTAARAEFLSRR